MWSPHPSPLTLCYQCPTSANGNDCALHGYGNLWCTMWPVSALCCIAWMLLHASVLFCVLITAISCGPDSASLPVPQHIATSSHGALPQLVPSMTPHPISPLLLPQLCLILPQCSHITTAVVAPYYVAWYRQQISCCISSVHTAVCHQRYLSSRSGPSELSILIH